jgi:RNA polymerase primary sigma factor
VEPLSDIDKFREELVALADNLPFRVIELPDFKSEKFEPEKIRQPRNFISPDSSMMAVGRFLVERGTVELLAPPMTIALFTEMHWCGWRIGKISRKQFKTPEDARAALSQARSLVSRIEAAEEELFIANRRMIVASVKPYFWVGQVWLADFLQEGSKALANAIRKFDFTRGVPFYSYSQTAVQNRLRNFFRDHVRDGSFGVKPSREMTLVKSIVDTWIRDYGTEPSDEAVAKISDLTAERVAKVRGYVKQWSNLPAPPLSLDAELTEDGASRYELIEDVSAASASQGAENAEIWAAMEQLPERARYIMKLRFIEGRTLEETGVLLKLTRARIKQIQDASVKKIRAILNEHDSAS